LYLIKKIILLKL